MSAGAWTHCRACGARLTRPQDVDGVCSTDDGDVEACWDRFRSFAVRNHWPPASPADLAKPEHSVRVDSWLELGAPS